MLKKKYVVALGVGLALVLIVEWFLLHRNPRPPEARLPAAAGAPR